MFLGLPDPDPLVRGMDPDTDQDPLVRGMDPRIRIRIHTKMSWIRNTAVNCTVYSVPVQYISEAAKKGQVLLSFIFLVCNYAVFSCG